MARIALLTEGALFPEGGRIAGLQVRVLEMARALGRRGHDVTVGEETASTGVEPGVNVTATRALRGNAFDVWIAHPRLVARHHRRFRDLPLVLDGYEAPFASFLAFAEAQGSERNRRVLSEYSAGVAETLRALRRADLVICANGPQRAGYLSLLGALGRLSPLESSPRIVQIVQTGAPPSPTGESLRAREEREGGQVVLWPGGAYPWFDLDTFVEAMPLVLDAVPSARFVFAGLGGQDGGTPRPAPIQQMLESPESQPLVTASTFVDWLPYAERREMYDSADIGVCTYRVHVETLFSMRTRVIDMAWGGLPVVATQGDEASQLLAAHHAAVTVPAEDPTALASEIVALLRDDNRRDAMKRNALALASGAWSWDAQIAPLHEFCKEPWRLSPARRIVGTRSVHRIIRVNGGRLWRVRQGLRRISPRRVTGLARRLRAPWPR